MTWKILVVLLAGCVMYVYSQPKVWNHLVADFTSPTVADAPASAPVIPPPPPAPAKPAPVAVIQSPAPQKSNDFNPNAGPNDLDTPGATHTLDAPGTTKLHADTLPPATLDKAPPLGPPPALTTPPPAKLNP